MWKTKGLILKGVNGRKVLNKGTLSAATAIIGVLTAPEITDLLWTLGIAEKVESWKLNSSFAVVLAGLAGAAWNYFIHRVWKQRERIG